MTALGHASSVLLHLRPIRWQIGGTCAFFIVISLVMMTWAAFSAHSVETFLAFGGITAAATLVYINFAYGTFVDVTNQTIAHRWFFGLRHRTLPWAQIGRVRYERIGLRSKDAARLLFDTPDGTIAIDANWYDAGDIERLVEYCRYRDIDVAQEILQYVDWETRFEDDPRPPFGSEPPRWPPA
jgi:hypothetical protein